MLGLNNKTPNENIKNPPSGDSYSTVQILFAKTHEITIKTLSLTILELIDNDQIKCEIDLDESYEVGKKLTPDDMEVMKKITLRIANKGELKTSQTLALKLLKNMNKNKKFNLKFMAKQSNNTAIANKFEKDLGEFVKAINNECNNHEDILENGKLTDKGKELKNEWKNFQNYLKSKDLTEKYPPESIEENSMQILYASCFDIEKDALKIRENNTQLTDFIDKDGYKLLNIIFNNALVHVSEKRKGDGIFYGVNDKYTIPGGA